MTIRTLAAGPFSSCTGWGCSWGFGLGSQVFDAATNGIIPSLRLARLHVFRHGEVVTGPARVCRGHTDAPLSDLGHQQSRLVADRFLAQYGPPARVFSSDLSRCRDLAVLFQAPVETIPDLREQHMGDWEGRTWESLTRENGAAVTAFWDDYVAGRPPGGESWGEAAARVQRWYGAQRPLEGRIVVVTHIGPIRALLCGWLGLGPGQGLRFAPAYASETVVLDADAGAVIESLGVPCPQPNRC